MVTVKFSTGQAHTSRTPRDTRGVDKTHDARQGILFLKQSRATIKVFKKGRKNKCAVRVCACVCVRVSVSGIDPCQVLSRFSIGALGHAMTQPTTRPGACCETRQPLAKFETFRCLPSLVFCDLSNALAHLKIRDDHSAKKKRS